MCLLDFLMTPYLLFFNLIFGVQKVVNHGFMSASWCLKMLPLEEYTPLKTVTDQPEAFKYSRHRVAARHSEMCL